MFSFLRSFHHLSVLLTAVSLAAKSLVVRAENSLEQELYLVICFNNA